MPLPHFTQIPIAASVQEPVYLNLFEISFILPTILQAQLRDPFVLLQQATSVEMNLTPDIAIKTQRFKYSTRVFMGTPEQTHTDFTIKFNVNVNSAGSMESWNSLKAWYDVIWNSQNGALHYKADSIGTIIVNHHDRKGKVIRRVTYNNVQITGLQGVSLNWEGNGDILNVDAKFVSDFFVDEYIDGNYTITPDLIPGY